jgi:hypothetical protein
LNVGYSADGLSGGVLLGVKGQGGIGLFDWYVSYLSTMILSERDLPNLYIGKLEISFEESKLIQNLFTGRNLENS